MRDMRARVGRLEAHHIKPRRSIMEFTDIELEAMVAGAGIDPSDNRALEAFVRGDKK